LKTLKKLSRIYREAKVTKEVTRSFKENKAVILEAMKCLWKFDPADFNVPEDLDLTVDILREFGATLLGKRQDQQCIGYLVSMQKTCSLVAAKYINYVSKHVLCAAEARENDEQFKRLLLKQSKNVLA